MKKIMFNDKYGLTQAVLEGRKTITRRIIRLPDGTGGIFDWSHSDKPVPLISIQLKNGGQRDITPTYEIGEEVAIAQKYYDLRNCDAFYECMHKDDPYMPLECIGGEKGACNKMFVKAAWMPHRIRITNIRVEMLQHISDEDCLREGISWDYSDYPYMEKKVYNYNDYEGFQTPRLAFASLINRVSGKGTWEMNPWVWVYEFQLIK